MSSIKCTKVAWCQRQFIHFQPVNRQINLVMDQKIDNIDIKTRITIFIISMVHALRASRC